MKVSVLIKGVVLAAFCVMGHTAMAAEPQQPVVRLAQLTIKPDQLVAFTSAVKEEMEAALRKEPGVLAIYAVADKNDRNKLTFIEMYANDAAYEAHRKTPHFQKYLRVTQEMIADRVLTESVPVELRDKHNTPLDK